MIKNNTLTGLFSPVFFGAALLLAELSLPPAATSAQAMLLPTRQLAIGESSVHVEVAATEASRQHGLMERRSLPADQGMLFVFDSPAVQCFWMKNTPLPLSIAFIDTQGVILAITDMQPQSRAVHCPPGPILYALEMQQGWFTGRQIVAGTSINGLPPP